jgi:hypothetical protein
MSWIVKLFQKLAGYFKSPKAKEDAEKALQYALMAAPYIKLAGQVVTTLTPTGVDDAAWALITGKYPRLFDGSLVTGDERKLYALGIAGELLEARFPGLDTSIARTAVQLAWLEQRTEVKANA